ncbi:MAG: hypothetical protein ACYC2O_02580 [Microthrixaceae bacterium]
MSSTAVTVLSIVAPAVYLARLLPQPVRLYRTGVAAGVSPLAAMNGVIGDVGWFGYGLSAGLPAVWTVAAAALVPAVWTVRLLRHRIARMDLLGAAAWALVLVVSAAFGVIGLSLAAGVLVAQGPQVVEAVRDADLSGIAPGTWYLALLDATAWGAYGLAVRDTALVTYGVVLSVAAVLVLGRIAWTTHRGTTFRAARRPWYDTSP